jgi:Peroxiredoxin
MLRIGDKMPSFEVQDQDGKTVRSEDFIGKGRRTIIYFYPKDNTSGCTAEACSMRDGYAALTAAGYNVVGVSKDSVKSHAGFRAKHGLPFTLLSDASTQMLQDFGAWGEKKMYGKTVFGTIRRTFIFNEEGILERIIEKVDTKDSAGQIISGMAAPQRAAAERVARVQAMEAAFDRASAGTPDAADVAVLKEYMDSGQWRLDYEADEAGEIPASVKRGVLSEDGLYNLLEDLA